MYYGFKSPPSPHRVAFKYFAIKDIFSTHIALIIQLKGLLPNGPN